MLSPTALLEEHAALVGSIRQLVGVPSAHWEQLYLPLLRAFADLVQKLPASEAHHHAEAGGLLRHSLETTHRALIVRRGVLLPRGASSEEIAQHQDVWTYATASAALLHDLGKILADQRIQLCNRHGEPREFWNPLQGPMRAEAYRVTFVRGRKYRFHPRLTPLLVHHVVPELALRWLAEDPDAFETWVASISGGDAESAGELQRIICAADAESAAADLSGGQLQRTPAATAVPLAERLVTALRHLLDSGELPLNRPGAAGFIVGTDLWLVSKRVLDSLRDHLIGQGQSGIPSRNERLMDELQQRGWLISNGDRAVWFARVSSGSWASELSLLRTPVARLWPSAEGRPSAFDGAVVPVLPSSTVPLTDAAAASLIHGDMSASTAATALVAAPPAPTIPSTALADGLPTLPLASYDVAASPAPVETTMPREESTIDEPAIERPGSELLKKSPFLAWLVEGIHCGRLKANAVDARVHFVPEGMLLVSPGIFRDFAHLKWDAAQKELLRLKCHLKRPDGTNIWTYRVHGENRARGLLKGILIPDPAMSLGVIPPRINPHLRLESAANPAEPGKPGEHMA